MGQVPIISAAISFSTGPGATPVYVDVSHFVKDLDVEYGRQDERQEFSTGRAVATYDNRDRRFSPFNNGILVNLFPNPSFETDTGFWGVNNGTLTRDSSVHVFGLWSGKGTAGASGGNYYYATSVALSGVTAGRIFSASVYVKGTGSTIGKQCSVFMSEVGGASGEDTSSTAGTTDTKTLTANWQRFEVFRRFVQNDRTNARVYISQQNAPASGDVIFMDGVQIEEAPWPTQYIDGSIDNGRWSGVAHASTSLRGGPYYPNVKKLRRVRYRSLWPVNYVTNSSFETNLSGWGPYGATTLNRVSNAGQAFQHGSWMAQFTPTGAHQGMYFSTAEGVIPGQPYTLSAYVNYASGKLFSLYIDEYDANGNFTEASSTAFFGTGSMVRFSHTKVLNKLTKQVNMFIISEDATNPVTSVEAVQFELGSQATSFMGDGIWRGEHVGFIENFPTEEKEGLDLECTLQSNDLFEILNNTTLTLATLPPGVSSEDYHLEGVQTVRSVERSDQRVSWLLDLAGVPAGDRSITTGITNVAPILWDPSTDPSLTVNALAELRECAKAERGHIYVNFAGQICFVNRHWRLLVLGANLGTYGDGTGETPYVDDTVEDSIDMVINEARVRRKDQNAAMYFAEDTTSKTDYLIRAWPSGGGIEEVNAASDGEVEGLAAYMVDRYKQASERITRIVLEGSVDGYNILNRDIGEKITVNKRYFKRGSTFSQISRIERRRRKFALGMFSVEWGLSPLWAAEETTYWQLEAGGSQLGTNTYLAF